MKAHLTVLTNDPQHKKKRKFNCRTWPGLPKVNIFNYKNYILEQTFAQVHDTGMREKCTHKKYLNRNAVIVVTTTFVSSMVAV